MANAKLLMDVYGNIEVIIWYSTIVSEYILAPATICSHGQVVKSSPLHGDVASSNLAGSTIKQ